MAGQQYSPEIVLEHGGCVVLLRPSLRAAIQLARLHDGFPQLLRKIEEFDTRTIWKVIEVGAGRQERAELAAVVRQTPFAQFARTAKAACLALVASLLPGATEKADAAPVEASSVPWPNLFSQLYGYATGWLRWPPEIAWAATPQEILDAFDAHIEMLKLLHGTAETRTNAQSHPKPPRQDGMDPEFDLAGLMALKQMASQKVGSVIQN